MAPHLDHFKSVKYRCSHCNHTFELEAKDFRRCPNCFWTTSLVELADEKEETSTAGTVSPPVSGQEVALRRWKWRPILRQLLFLIAVAGVIGILWFFFFGPAKVGDKMQQNFTAFIASKAVSKPQEIPGAPKTEIARGAELRLSEEERTSLLSGFKIETPRPLTQDEEEVLKKRVSRPEQLTAKPVIKMWTEDDFSSLLQQEQKKRKITLGWVYVRSLKKTFEKNYLPGGEAFQAGNYELARDFFIRSLSFPVYQNDPRLYRAVVLVMLRPFINDVIGKAAVLNQYFLRQSSLGEVDAVSASYEALFGFLTSRDWSRALESVRELKNRIGRFESKPQEVFIQLPPTLGEIDPELQNAVRTEAAPKADAVMSWKAVLIDLGLKEEIVKQNLPESLKEVQAAFDTAVQLLE